MSKLLLLTKTNSELAPLIARVNAGAIIFPHGAQKLFGWFGGYGFEGTMNFMTTNVGLPWIIAFLVILGESIGGLMLILGAGTRFAAISLSIIMIGAAKMHLVNGFFMNWMGELPGEGVEYHLLLLGLAISIFVAGAGSFSVDAAISNKLKK